MQTIAFVVLGLLALTIAAAILDYKYIDPVMTKVANDGWRKADNVIDAIGYYDKWKKTADGRISSLPFGMTYLYLFRGYRG